MVAAKKCDADYALTVLNKTGSENSIIIII